MNINKKHLVESYLRIWVAGIGMSYQTLQITDILCNGDSVSHATRRYHRANLHDLAYFRLQSIELNYNSILTPQSS